MLISCGILSRNLIFPVALCSLMYIHDQAANAELSGKLLFESDNWRTEVCVCHRLQNCLKHALEDIPALRKLLAKCRKVAGHF